MRFSLACLLFLVSASLHAQLADFKHLRFTKADSVAHANLGEGVTDLATLSGKLTAALTTDAEKFRAIYVWVCTNIEFDYEVFRLNRERRDDFDTPEELKAWNKKLAPLVFRNLVREKKTVCTGYAWLIQQLATHAGLACVMIDGYGRTAKANSFVSGKPNHSWNAVKLANKWYLCDATWSSGAYDTDRDTYVRNLDLCYFLADPEVFARNHYPLESAWLLLEPQTSNTEHQTTNLEPQTSSPEHPTFEQFTSGPIVYSSAYRHNIRDLSPATFDLHAAKGETMSFKFASDEQVENVELSVHTKGKVDSFHPVLYKDETGRYCMNHTFTNKGRQVVHVLLDKRYAFTYSVKVK